MLKRTLATTLMALALVTLALSLTSRVTAQEEHKQTVYVFYDSNVVLSGKGEDAVRCQTPVFFQIYATSAALKKKYGEDPLASEDITATGNGDSRRKDIQLPLGSYEIHFSTRNGADMITCIKPFVLRADAASEVHVDFSNAKTLIYGDSVPFQLIVNAVSGLAERVATLQAEIDALKGKTVPPAPGPTDAPAK